MTRGRLWGYFAGTAAVAALIGFLFGWYQAYPAQHSRDRALLRLRLAEARSRTLDARMALANANYGDTRAHVEEGIRLLEAFRSPGQRELPPTETAKVEQAQQLLKDALAMVSAAPATSEAGTVAPATDVAAKTQQAGNLLGEVYRATPEP